MVLAEYAFILRVIQMEKRKGDAARRTLSKSVKAVVAANQVIQGSQATYSISQMDFLSFPFSIAKITLSTFLSLSAFLSFFPAHPREQYFFFAPRPQARGAERWLDAFRTGRHLKPGFVKNNNQGSNSPSNLIFPQHEFIYCAVNMLMMMSSSTKMQKS